MNVLIADDDHFWVRILSSYFSSQGHAVRSAATYKAAFALASAEPPDCVIADGSLDDMSAADFCRLLRADPRFDRTAVVEVSGAEPEEEHGTDAFLLKDGDIEKIERVACAAARTRALPRRARCQRPEK